jgi:hypothetical protein
LKTFELAAFGKETARVEKKKKKKKKRHGDRELFLILCIHL